MINKILFLFFALALLLTACQGREATGEPPASEAAPAVTADSFATSQAPADQPTGSPAAASTAGQVKAASCTVVSTVPTPGPTEQSLFPPVGEADWVHGPDTAEVTIIEYGDFM